MRYGFLWLTIRMMIKQKLRTCSIFCGVAMSGFLLSVFANFGFYFLGQVYGGKSDAAEYDSTEWVLVSLASVLLILIVSCSVMLLYNLCSLTYVQKWRSISCLMAIGAAKKDIIFMTMTESSLICFVAIPIGQAAAIVVGKCVDMGFRISLWMLLGIFILLLIISNFCGIKTALSGVYKPMLSANLPWQKKHCLPGFTDKKKLSKFPFSFFMARKYYMANRKRYTRILLTIIIAIIIYIPASYFINTNILVQRSELDKRYGIQYTYNPINNTELKAGLDEYYNLKNSTDDGAMVCVYIEGEAEIKADLLSRDFSRVLQKAGWNGGKVFQSSSKICFLEDDCFEHYFQDSISEKIGLSVDNPVILVNRCKNRTIWKEGVDNLFPETSLLNTDAWDRKNILDETDGQDMVLGVKIYYGNDNENYGMPFNKNQYICPNILNDELPEEIEFTGDVTLILPLSQLEHLCCRVNDCSGIQICGYFEDTNEIIFDKLRQQMGQNSMGKLRYTRKIFQEWYDSMADIHLAMRFICMILFFIAILNVFQIIIFQYIERKSGLAVLWTLGQTEKNLFQIFILENVRPFLTGIIVGVPVSCVLCYYIYNIFRYVWQIEFSLPFYQIALIVVFAFFAFAAAICMNLFFIKRQNFLEDIRRY